MKARLFPVALALAAMPAACGPAPEPVEPEPVVTVLPPTPFDVERATERFTALRDDFLSTYFDFHPVRASLLGRTGHDHAFPGMSRTAVQERIDRLLDWLSALEEVAFTHLEGADRYDYAVLEYALRAELLELEETREWVRDPRLYTALIARGVGALADGAAGSAGLEALESRLRAAPAILEAARENLEGPPALWTERALADTRALIRYLEEGLPESSVASSGLSSGVASARSGLVEALEGHARWLRTDLAPRSTGDYRLGRYLLERKLLYEEHIALSVPELDRINERALEELGRRLEEVAREVDPDRSPREVLDSLAAEHPSPEALPETVREMMESLSAWSEARGVVPVPPHQGAVVRTAPAWRSGDPATLTAPGPYGEGPAYLDLALPAEGPEGGRAAGMAPFAYSELLALTAHQSYPGHLVQRLYERGVESELRRIFPTRSFVEGWAHYAEQVVLEAGYGGDDPALRLGLLRRALERHARWYASLHLHALDTPLDRVVERFAELAFLSESAARREVERATYDPTYLADALGRLQINELRTDYAAWLEEEGRTLSAAAFHRTLLELALPLPLAREALIPEPGERAGSLQLIPPRR